MKSVTEIDDAVAAFNAELPPEPFGCDSCGGSIQAVTDYISRAEQRVPVLVLDIAHSDPSCTVLTEKGMRGTFAMGDSDTQVFCRHRFDDGDPIWRQSLP